MAQVYGQIESLKKLKNELYLRGINRFNSIKEINEFLNNFQNEKEEIIANQREILKNEIKNLNLKIQDYQDRSESIKKRTIAEIDVSIDSVTENINILSAKINQSFIHKLIYGFKLKKQNKILEYYKTKSSEIILNATKNVHDSIKISENILNQFINNNDLIINDRSSSEIQKLNHIKKTIEDLHPLIAGTVGENLVVKEIEKLSNEHVLINDFNLKFNPPIYNRNTNDKIFSIQIDHLLVSKSGIYILETKNWSKNSIDSLDLRSPVEQITRTSYALFVLVNDAKISLTEHHWGDKQIPIKNIIVMINEKPKEEFKYVKVKSLKELNNYLTYFEPIFSDMEVDRISKFLIRMQN